ncbi:MAG: Guanylate kinase, partial [Pseudomonadota bacterium]
SWIESQMQKGSDVILEIDWQGAQQIRQYIPQAIWIFIFPPSIEALEQRLHKRGQDDEQTIAKRVAAAHIELQHAHQAEFIVINEIFADALRDLQAIVLQAIVAASRLRTNPMMARFPALVKRLGA